MSVHHVALAGVGEHLPGRRPQFLAAAGVIHATGHLKLEVNHFNKPWDHVVFEQSTAEPVALVNFYKRTEKQRLLDPGDSRQCMASC